MSKAIKMYSDEKFATKIRTLMGNQNIGLREIAEATGCAVSTASTWRRGRIPRSPIVIDKLAKCLGVSKNELLDKNAPEVLVFSNSDTSKDDCERKCIEFCHRLILETRKNKLKHSALLKRLHKCFPEINDE